MMEKVFIEAQEKLGGKIDFVLHSVAMSPNVRKHRTYDDLDYNFLNKTLDISAISFHKMLQVAKKLDAINEWGSVVALTYVASQRTFFGYNDMADAKSMLESIARSFGYIYGREKHVRINTISQSPTATTAGKGIKDIENMMDFADKMSPLGNAVAEDCANYCVMMFSDFTRKVTMREVVRFAIVGGIATVLQYVIYLAAMPLLANLIPALGNSDHTLATVANTLAYILSFIFNFIASTRYTFKVKANAKRGAGFTFSHIVNYSMQTLFLNLFVGLGLAKQMAMIPTLCICIPVNFLLVRFFLKK